MSDQPNWKTMAERTTILRADVGSRGFGLSTATSDHDEKGVCIEDLDSHVCLDGKFEQHIEQRKEDPDPSNHLDLEIFALDKFLRLAIHGNPTIVSLLFVKDYLQVDARGLQLQELVPYLISRHWGKRFLGYMESQRQKLKGERGQMRVTRTDLITKYGFDTKFAMHLLRLGYQGIEIMETGKMTLPMGESDKALLMQIRGGMITLNEVLQIAGDLERHLKDLITSTHLPDQPNRDYINEWMRDTYYENWKSRKFRVDQPYFGTRGRL